MALQSGKYPNIMLDNATVKFFYLRVWIKIIHFLQYLGMFETECKLEMYSEIKIYFRALQ